MERKKIILYRSTAIGDVVLSTPSAFFLEKTKPETTDLYWITSGNLIPSLKRMVPWVTFIDERERDQLIRSLNAYDVIINLQMSFKAIRFTWACRLKSKCKVYSFPKDSFRRFLLVLRARFRKRTPTPSGQTPHYPNQATNMLNFVRSIYPPLHKANLTKCVTIAETYELLREGFANPYRDKRFDLAIAPGASYPAKRLPVSLIVKILDEILKSREPTKFPPDLEIVIIGGRADQYLGQTLSRLLRQRSRLNVTDHTGNLELYETARVLAESKHLLTADSAPAHLAEAMSTTVSVLFGPTSEQFGFSPLSKLSKSFSAPIGCRPCSKHGHKLCRFADYDCFHLISPNAVANHICESLSC